MTEQATQAVVKETDTPAPQGGEVESAREDGTDLDTLLAQFEQGTTPPAPVSPPETRTTADPELETIKQVATQWQQQMLQKEIDGIVKAVRGDIPADVYDDELVEAWLDARARKDTRLRDAFVQRGSKPTEWKRIQAQLGKELQKKVARLPDRQATEDRAAVVQAVRGASTPAIPSEPTPDFGQMTDAELRAYTRQFGF